MTTHGVTTMRHHPERFLFTALAALHRGYPLGRPMTTAERLFCAALSTAPTHMLTLHAADGLAASGWWPRLQKRVNRMRGARGPMIYLGTKARGQGKGGDHLHLLTWDWLPAGPLHGHARELGIGRPQIKQIPNVDRGLLAAAQVVSYAIAQHEPIFGSRHHLDHEARVTRRWNWIHPQAETLARYKPTLLSAVDLAKTRSLSDEALVSTLPMFRSSRRLLTSYMHTTHE